MLPAGTTAEACHEHRTRGPRRQQQLSQQVQPQEPQLAQEPELELDLCPEQSREQGFKRLESEPALELQSPTGLGLRPADGVVSTTLGLPNRERDRALVRAHSRDAAPPLPMARLTEL